METKDRNDVLIEELYGNDIDTTRSIWDHRQKIWVEMNSKQLKEYLDEREKEGSLIKP